MTEEDVDLQAKAERLRALHRGEMLVLPNVWDAPSATIVAEAGGRAVATASAAISAMLGYPDGEGAPWSEMFAAAARVARAVSIAPPESTAFIPSPSAGSRTSPPWSASWPDRASTALRWPTSALRSRASSPDAHKSVAPASTPRVRVESPS